MNQITDQVMAGIAAMHSKKRLSESTYRLQFHEGFKFKEAAKIVSYLHDLGISDCYSSPLLKARAGSKHGYDIIDHKQLNPEIGTEEEFSNFAASLKYYGMGQILDIVPNHMDVSSNENAWWQDVLENGEASAFAEFFDVAWSASLRNELQGRILLPILSEPYGKALEAQLLRLHYEEGKFTIHYFEKFFPVAPQSYAFILEQRISELESLLGSDSKPLLEYHSILTAIKHLPSRNDKDPSHMVEGQREKEVIKRRLADLTSGCRQVADFLIQTTDRFNGEAGNPQSMNLLDKLLDEQVYRLAFWRVAAEEINYRRFFDVNDLAALSIEREEVFLATHELVMRLLAEEKITGLRIDHPDGLYDPLQYLQRLQRNYMLNCAHTIFTKKAYYRGIDWKEAANLLEMRISTLPDPQNRCWPLYVVVEKILADGETLPMTWPTQGTSGYDFLNNINGLFVDSSQELPFKKIYQDWIQDTTSYSTIVYQKKILILQTTLASELQMLSFQLDRLAQKNRWSRDFTRHSLWQALREIIACFPVYRTYINSKEISDFDRRQVIFAVLHAKIRNPTMSTALFHFVRDTLLLQPLENASNDQEYQTMQQQFVAKFQQVTAPVVAKGVEDTAFYVFNRLLSLNEVGGNPDRFGISIASLHRILQDRQAFWPYALSATSTQDSKRSEDVRARLNVLSELPQEWLAGLNKWSDMNRSHRVEVDGLWAPDANEEYLLYQTLIGSWPIGKLSDQEYAFYKKRIQAYMHKALQEAKIHTSWINPNAAYDLAIDKFIECILDRKLNSAFIEDFQTFQHRISHYGMFNSLSQLLLKIAAPGVSDIYQGMELWNFSLVDPDNRRPVDFSLRIEMLRLLQEKEKKDNLTDLAMELTAQKEDSRIKLFTTYKGLQCRLSMPGLFTSGSYIPIEVTGKRHEHAFSFMRQEGFYHALVVVPRLLTRIVSSDCTPCGMDIWHDTRLKLTGPSKLLQWRNVFTGELLNSRQIGEDHILEVGQLLKHFPIALLISQGGTNDS